MSTLLPSTPRTHRGPAVIFESEEDALEAVLQQRIRPGDIVVIRKEDRVAAQACGKCPR